MHDILRFQTWHYRILSRSALRDSPVSPPPGEKAIRLEVKICQILVTLLKEPSTFVKILLKTYTVCVFQMSTVIYLIIQSIERSKDL